MQFRRRWSVRRCFDAPMLVVFRLKRVHLRMRGYVHDQSNGHMMCIYLLTSEGVGEMEALELRNTWGRYPALEMNRSVA